MAHTNSTTHYQLPVFVSNDKPAWLVDFNSAMNTLDTVINSVETSSPIITVTNTDPGEGVSLAANHFIAVYED